MPALLKRTQLRDRLVTVFSDPETISRLLDPVVLPPALKTWLTRLMLLYGVPFNALVPDEGMLPPESIRFFYLDMSWIDALVDGAFSIGRNLTSTSTANVATRTRTIDRAVHSTMRAAVRSNLGAIRAAALGVSSGVVSSQLITGFIMRSSLVTGYPGMGVLAYAAGKTDPLTVLRMEPLGPQSDTMICLIDGDAAQVDIHEPPEALHFGIDYYKAAAGPVQAYKNVYDFSVKNGVIKIPGTSQKVTLDTTFRTISPRVLQMATAAGQIAAINNLPDIDSAEMGFEMTEGVGMVSFLKA